MWPALLGPVCFGPDSSTHARHSSGQSPSGGPLLSNSPVVLAHSVSSASSCSVVTIRHLSFWLSKEILSRLPLFQTSPLSGLVLR